MFNRSNFWLILMLALACIAVAVYLAVALPE
jgi:uncharacterized membrane protein YhaH (DUF805 family)